MFILYLMIYDSNCNTISCAYSAIWYIVRYICVCGCVYVCIYIYRLEFRKSRLAHLSMLIGDNNDC